jgi:hypothetical protein
MGKPVYFLTAGLAGSGWGIMLKRATRYQKFMQSQNQHDLHCNMQTLA